MSNGGSSTHPVLEVERLALCARSHHGETSPVTDVSFAVAPGGSLALVGESGSGKSLTLRAVLGLLPPRISVSAGSIRFGDGTGPPQVRDPERLRGRGLAFVPQEPMTAMNPTMRLADLVAAGPRATTGISRRAARAMAVDLLREVGIARPDERADAWPHELSGGMRQRAMIAMALATEPSILLCDEPTTALDVTVQDQVIRLLDRIRCERHLALVFVTHDLALAAQLCERVAVMYAGRVVEAGPTESVFTDPAHRYTEALLAAVPEPSRRADRLASIPGNPPVPAEFGPSCRFAPRCTAALDLCHEVPHVAVAIGRAEELRWTACVNPPEPWASR
jgi:oligopeptide/dipeptide ABC transporter ATP-binding protein